MLHVEDTTGAGDCFTGALAVALLEGKSYQEAMRFASELWGRNWQRSLTVCVDVQRRRSVCVHISAGAMLSLACLPYLQRGSRSFHCLV